MRLLHLYEPVLCGSVTLVMYDRSKQLMLLVISVLLTLKTNIFYI